MEVDEIIFAVGELYLKLRKSQQTVSDLSNVLKGKEQEIEELKVEIAALSDDAIEPEEQEGGHADSESD